MLEVISKQLDNKIVGIIKGRIDSANAGEFDKSLETIDTLDKLILDVEDLEYMSSAGLRVILKYRKKHSDLEIINASTDLYEIFDMTGFTEMINIKRAYKKVSVEGCEVIGQGSNGKVYRIDQDTVVKVYLNDDSLKDIEHEREVARKALVLGIPTAISYDVVKVGEHYASMFEMLDSKSLSKILAANPEDVDEYSKVFVDLLKLIHSTVAEEGQLPNQKERLNTWICDLKSYLSEDVYEKLQQLSNEIPYDNHIIHGDYHPSNIHIQNGEAILIDMDTLSVGHPILEFGSIYNAFLGFHLDDPYSVKDFLRIDYPTALRLWENTLKLYYETDDEEILSLRENQAKVIGLTRLLRRSIRKKEDNAKIMLYKNELEKTVRGINSLV